LENGVGIPDRRQTLDEYFGCDIKRQAQYWISDDTELFLDDFALGVQPRDLAIDFRQTITQGLVGFHVELQC
jgi:hypothetical protein